MIVEWLMKLGTDLAAWFVSLFPQGDAPDFVLTLDDKINGLLANLGGVGVWADWPYMIGVVSVVVGIWAIGFAVKAVLTLWKLIPVIGGG